MIKKILKPAYISVKQRMLIYRLALVPVRELSEHKTVLIIAPHPDDEILGLGGFIIQQLERGADVYVAYLTDGERSLADLSPEKVAGERIEISERVLHELNIAEKNIFRFHLPDGQLPRSGSHGFTEAMELLSELVGSLKPDAVFVTHFLDTWPYDHVAAYELAEATMAETDASDIFLYGYWVWLSYSLPVKRCYAIDWKHTIRISVDNEMEIKKKLMGAYLSPTAPNGKPWSGVLPKAMLQVFEYPYEIVTLHKVTSKVKRHIEF